MIKAIVFGVVSALILSGCAEMFPAKYRFKMTVEVETPEGLRAGSSVYEVWASNKTKILPEEAGRTWGASGEAVSVDVIPGKTLFALLKTKAHHGDMASLSMQTLDPLFKYDVVQSAERIAKRQGIKSPAAVAPEHYPMLVTFRDTADPKSVAAVDAADLAATFGRGIKLRRITVEVTDRPVTNGIQKRLEWLGSYYAKRLDGQRFGDGTSLANDLSAGAFSTEANR